MYAVIDRGKMRSHTDGIVAAELAEEWGVNIETLKSASYASAVITAEFTGAKSNSATAIRARSTTFRIQFIENWREEVVMADSIIQQANHHVRKLLYRGAVLAVMMETLRYDPERAMDFWTAVATGEGLVRDTGPKVLLDWLMTNPMKTHPDHVYARYVANCWNAYRRNQTLIRPAVRPSGVIDPILILGTPYSENNRTRVRTNRLEAERLRGVRRGPGRLKEVSIEKEEVYQEVPPVQSSERLLGAVSLLLEENYGPSPQVHQSVLGG